MSSEAFFNTVSLPFIALILSGCEIGSTPTIRCCWKASTKVTLLGFASRRNFGCDARRLYYKQRM
jgi:hypothetical protein